MKNDALKPDIGESNKEVTISLADELSLAVQYKCDSCNVEETNKKHVSDHMRIRHDDSEERNEWKTKLKDQIMRIS